ncbi:MAG: leucine-rich repeat domain-containing protein [Saprospiraceae bacterium]|nr:leucine-rich repeat domain-containing protein [Saprospiraceae bacterium]
MRSCILYIIISFVIPNYTYLKANDHKGKNPTFLSEAISPKIKIESTFFDRVHPHCNKDIDKGFNLSETLTNHSDVIVSNNPTHTKMLSPSVNLSISQVSAPETGLPLIIVTATNDVPVIGDQYVFLDVSGMGITFGDYSVSGYQINIADGSSAGSILFYVQDDLLVEGNEVATLSLYGPSVGLALGPVIAQNLTINDNEICGGPSGILINTQAQANAFRSTYPGCLVVEGDLTINDDDGMGTDLVSIDSLYGLTGVNGALGIFFNPVLTKLDSLNNITQVGGDVSIFDNNIITNLAGLSGLTSHTGTFSVYNNTALNSLNGIYNLTTFNNLNIYSNPALINLNGLANADIINGSLYISGNDNLIDISGLSSISSVGSSLTISSNPALTTIQELTQLISVNESLFITDNASLENVNGFLFLESIALDLYIDNNGALTEYCGLNPIMDSEVNMGGTAIGGTITITNNAVDPSPSDIVMNGACGSLQNERTGQRYTSLQDAINDADPMGGDTILFLDNIEESFVAYNSVYVNSNGFTLTIPDEIPDVSFGRMEIYQDVVFIWLGGNIIVNPAGYIENAGTLHNNGTIIYQGGTGTFDNGAIYKGTGSFQGTIANYGSVKPGN